MRVHDTTEGFCWSEIYPQASFDWIYHARYSSFYSSLKFFFSFFFSALILHIYLSNHVKSHFISNLYLIYYLFFFLSNEIISYALLEIASPPIRRRNCLSVSYFRKTQKAHLQWVRVLRPRRTIGGSTPLLG